MKQTLANIYWTLLRTSFKLKVDEWFFVLALIQNNKVSKWKAHLPQTIEQHRKQIMALDWRYCPRASAWLNNGYVTEGIQSISSNLKFLNTYINTVNSKTKLADVAVFTRPHPTQKISYLCSNFCPCSWFKIFHSNILKTFYTGEH